VGNALQIGPWLVDPSLNTVSRNGESIHLEPKVMGVLVCLADHPGETLGKEKLLQTLWPDTFVTDDVLTRSISELRRVFEDNAKEPRVIQTIPKRGYRLIAPVLPANGAHESSLPAASASATNTVYEKPGRRHRLIASLAGLLAVGATVFAVNLGGIRTHMLPKTNPPTVHSLAVLPLVNLSNDLNQEYVADGLTDALITDLAQISSLRVISRTSTMRYKKTAKTLPEIARELNVDGIVEGTVQRSGDRVRITAQLVQGSTDTHLWARSYERDMSDVLALEGEAASSLAEEIRAQLTPQEKARLGQSRSANLPALEAYLQGEHHFNNYGKGYAIEELKRAAEYFQLAITQDPSFAPAYIKLAETYDREDEMSPSSEVFPKEEAIAEKALALDPNLSDAHLALARVKFSYEWDWTGVENEVRKALELNPNNANAHEVLGDYFEVMGRLNEGVDEQQRAEELDPQADPDHLTNGLYRTRQYDRGIEWLRKQIEINPDEGVHYIQLMDFYAEKGMQKEYMETVVRVLTLYGFTQLAESLRRNYSAEGYTRALRDLNAETEKLEERGVLFMPGIIAEIYTKAGDKEKAIHWLQIAVQEHDGSMPFLNCDAEWDSLRSDPRFKNLVRRVGLPPQ
jgi:TolB-like protein/DNA-binding winged helix-turn-helix (wHTH) protein/Tfp pilus assembly protein PilF